MSVEGLENCSKDQLIAELIHRGTFAGIVHYCRGDAKDGRLEPGELVISKSPPLTDEGVKRLLQWGLSIVPKSSGDHAATEPESAATSLPLMAERPPLRVNEGVVLRVGTSRVSFDVVVEQYENGMSPEDMVRAYDSLSLADVHAVVGYYLRHRDAVRRYLQHREDAADALRLAIENERPPITRQELLTRRAAGEQAHASACH
jgi:uncharacterized protein (DUF433 family)